MVIFESGECIVAAEVVAVAVLVTEVDTSSWWWLSDNKRLYGMPPPNKT